MAVKIDKGSALSELSLTPLIDVVFLLLIFFLVATRFAEEEKEMDLMLAEASTAEPATSKPRELVININEKGQYYVTGKVVTLPDLETILNQTWVNNPGRASAVIRADRRVSWNYVVDAVNACVKARIRDYKVTTQEKS